MKTIWKYPLVIEDQQTVEVPLGAVALSLQVQNDQPCLWVLVDDAQPKTPRTIYMRGTGHDCDGLPFGGMHLGTFQIHDGALVFHVFDGGEFVDELLAR